MISLKDVLAEMSKTDEEGNAIPFSIKYVKHDKRRKKGGEVARYPEAILCFQTKKNNEPKENVPLNYKKPKHSQNETRNIEIINSGILTGTIRKMNILFIIEFNGKKVI